MKAKKRTTRRSAKRSAKKPATSRLSVELLTFPRVGEIWKGQGGRYAGVIRGENGQPDYAEVVADPKYWPKGAWGSPQSVAGALSEYDGLANTKAMAAAGGEIARKAMTVKIEGHADYYIAAKLEQRLAHLNQAAPGVTGWCWSSTQCRAHSAFAWAQGFVDGTQYLYRKYYELPFVLVRRVPIR